MFNSSVIDVAIGLVFVFLLLSLVASAVKEGLEAMFKRRAQDLEKGIKELVGEGAVDKNSDKQADAEKAGNKQDADQKAASSFVASLYDHGLINSLFAGKYGTPKAQLPSYIPSKNFALAMMALWKQSQDQPATITLPAHVKQAFDAFELTAGKDLDKMQKQLEDWYNSSMDRVSGWYKRRTQWWLFGIGIVITIVVNVDCVRITNRLSTDTTLRQAVIQAAQKEVDANNKASVGGSPASDPTIKGSADQIKADLFKLDGVGLPLGWKEGLLDYSWHQAEIKRIQTKSETKLSQDDKSRQEGQQRRDAYWNLIFVHIPGWLLTALAVSLGAPFWFDMLNKFMIVRSTVKPSEKSKEEGSKDPDTPKTASMPAK